MSEDKNLADWYTSERERYDGLSNIVRYLIEGLIKDARIDHLNVTSRTKTVESFLEKAQRKPYKDPEKEVTDLAGIRIITFIDSDVKKVGDLIKTSFNIHRQESLDKTDELGIDRFGYRSLHFICDLGKDRVKLPEFKVYKGLVFEVQVRTALQHAWAEIEHDRNYKFSGTLPSPIQRRLHLLAGVLELVDREFVAIANDIDKYGEEISKKTQKGELDVELNTASLTQYLRQKIDSVILEKITRTNQNELFNEVIEELLAFGIKTLADLDVILSKEFFEVLKNIDIDLMTETGLVRRAMMYEDVDRYFHRAWKNRFITITDISIKIITSKFGEEKMKNLMKKYKLAYPIRSNE